LKERHKWVGAQNRAKCEAKIAGGKVWNEAWRFFKDFWEEKIKNKSLV